MIPSIYILIYTIESY